MGKNRVKGIVVEIGGDTIGLNKALDGTNKKINATQSNLKDVERLLKFDPKNTVLLEQKQRLLAGAISETETKLEALNTASEQAADSAKNYDAWKAAFDPIQEEIDTTSKKLKDLKKQQSEMEDCGEVDTDAYKQLTEEIQNTSKELRDLKDRAKAVSDEFGNPISPEQYDSLQREIIETEQQLQKFKDSATTALDAASEKCTKLEKELGDLNKALELDPSDIKVLTQKQDVLKNSIEATTEKLEQLEARQQSLVDEFGKPISPEMYDSLQREIATTKTKLQNLEDSAEENFQKIADATDPAKIKLRELGDAAETVQKKADGVADAFKPVTTAVAGLATAAVATVPATEELREDLSKLDANAAESAVSIDHARAAWKKLAIQSGETDSAVEATSNLLQAGFTESNLQKAVEGLAGAALRFPDTLKVESLADSLQETLATGAATGQFAELIERLGLNLDDFNASMAACTSDAHRQNFALQTLANAGLNDSYLAWKQNNEEMLANKEANLELETSLAQLAEKVLPIVTDVTSAMADFIDWFTNLPGPAQGAIVAILGLLAAISPVAGAVGGAADVIEMLSSGKLPGLSSAFGTLTGTVLPGVGNTFSSVFGFILSNPVALLIGGIIGLVVLIGTKGDEIQASLQKVDDFLQGVFAKDWTEVFGPVLGGKLNDFFATCKEIWDSIKSILDGIIDFIRGVFTGDWERAWNGVVKIFDGIFSGLGALLKAPINAVIGLINDAISGINWLIDGVNKIPGVNLSTIGQIPMLANGGEVLRGSAVVGEAGPELLTVLGDRTVVQPLTNNTTNHSTHMGGITMHVYGAPGQDLRELAEIVMEEMQQAYGRKEAALT